VTRAVWQTLRAALLWLGGVGVAGALVRRAVRGRAGAGGNAKVAVPLSLGGGTASRTPEGEAAACPACGAEVGMEGSAFFSDAPCPACGALLWSVRLGGQVFPVAPSDRARSKGLTATLAGLLNVSEADLPTGGLRATAELDSVQFVELVLNFEEQAGA
jgi:acyl carrier protein